MGNFQMGPIFLRQLPFPLAIFIPPMLHPHLLITGSIGHMNNSALDFFNLERVTP